MKKIYILIAALLVILTISIFLITSPEEGIIIEDGRQRQVNVGMLTDDASYVDALGQQYDSSKVQTVFSHEGWYKGEYFIDAFRDVRLRMRISQDMIPGDGVIEGYAVEVIDDVPMIYVFVDEDWKRELPDTKMYWGKSYQNQKSFTFDEIADGIYMDNVQDDPSRFSEGYGLHFGGLYVGDFDKETLLSFS